MRIWVTGGIHRLDILSRTDYVRKMSVMRHVCVWLGAGWEVLTVRGLGLGFANPGGTCGKWDMCLCFGCGGVGGERSGRVGWCCES